MCKASITGGRGAAGLKTVLAACALAASAAVLVTCENQDPVAPAESTITVSANPQSIVVPPGGAGTSTITATVRGKSGARLPGQEIIFSTTQGTLDPKAQTPLTTDSRGQARCTLETSSAATVTAWSGSISGSTSVQIVTGSLSSLLLYADPQIISSCGETVDLYLAANDPNGEGVGGVSINITTKQITGFIMLEGNITPQQLSTDSYGEATATFEPAITSCEASCGSTDPNGGFCAIEITATAISQGISSVPVQITEDVGP